MRTIKQLKAAIKKNEDMLQNLVETYGGEQIMKALFKAYRPDAVADVLFAIKEELKEPSTIN